MSEQELQSLRLCIETFEKVILENLEKVKLKICLNFPYKNFKVLVFYSTKLNEIIEKWRKLHLNLLAFKEKKKTLKKDEKMEHFIMLKVKSILIPLNIKNLIGVVSGINKRNKTIDRLYQFQSGSLSKSM